MRFRRQQNGAAPLRHGLVEQILTLGDRQRGERALPILGLAHQIEQGLDRPGELAIELQGTFGKLARRLRFAFALGLEEEAAQPQLGGVRGGEHGLEDASRGARIAVQLRRLGTQQMRERLVGQRLTGL